MTDAFVHLPNVLVRCINDCGGYLAVRGGQFVRTEGQEAATRFVSDTKGWQASMEAAWGNVPPPDHTPHDQPFGPNGTMRCDGGGVGDCAEARAYRNAIVCPPCRATGWRLPTDDPSLGRA
jgi:hypothetical protein